MNEKKSGNVEYVPEGTLKQSHRTTDYEVINGLVGVIEKQNQMILGLVDMLRKPRFVPFEAEDCGSAGKRNIEL